MKVRIEIECENAAFERSPGRELGRILLRLSEDVRTFDFKDKRVGAGELCLHDVNGNTVGKMEVLP